MKLTQLKGIAHDLAHHLDEQIWFGKYKDKFSDFETNILEMKDSFDKEMTGFFKERIPKSFDISKIKSIIIHIVKKKNNLNIIIKIKINDKTISYESKSINIGK